MCLPQNKIENALQLYWNVILLETGLLESFSYLMNVPVAELGWYVNLTSVLVHGEVEVSAEAHQLHMVPVLVVQQTAHRDKKLPTGGGTHTYRSDGVKQSIVFSSLYSLEK